MFRRAPSSLLIAALVVLTTARARASEPFHTHLPGPESARSTPDWPAVRGGAILFGLGYGAALAVGADRRFQGKDGWLAVPVAGPWARLAAGGSDRAWGWVADGIAQGGGALIIVGGFVFQKRVLGPASGATPSLEFALAPGAAALSGRF